MSTTHIQPLPNVYGRMAYTELGEGKKRTENIQNGTNRIAAQMGDGDSREECVRFCSAMKRQNQGRENEGFEVRVSWAPEELSKDDPEDIQRACEYGYLLCKEVAPNAPCWVLSRALSSACWETASRRPATRRPTWTSSARSLGCAAWS